MTDPKELWEEVLRNSREDREALVRVRSNLMDAQADPLLIAEGVARVSETLTKVNRDLIEVAKASSEAADDEESFDRDDILDELERDREDDGVVSTAR